MVFGIVLVGMTDEGNDGSTATAPAKVGYGIWNGFYVSGSAIA